MKRYLLLLILTSAIVRFIFLNVIPAGINFEEIDYLLNAKTVFYAWTDISGQWNPLTLSTPPADEPRGELLPLVIAPFIGPLPFSLFASRLPFVLIGISAVVLVYLLARKLFGESVGRFAGLVAAFNPLLIFSSRLGYDTPPSATFYLLGLVLLLYLRGWSILLAFLPLFLAFHIYIGAKLVLVPFTLVAVWYAWKIENKGRFTKQYLLVIIFALLTTALFAIRLHSLPANIRSTNYFVPSHVDVASKVNNQRRLGLVEMPREFAPVNDLYVNKVSVYVKEVLNRVLGSVSFLLLFVNGDPYAPYFLWDHGVFYYADVIFLFIGLYFLVKKHPKKALLFGLLFPVLLLPAIFSGTQLSYVYRSYLIYVLLIVAVGLGLNYFLEASGPKRNLVAVGLVLIYAIQLLNFFQDYLIRNPVYHESQFQLTSRLVSRYLVEESKDNRKIVVVGADPNGLLRQYVLYSGLFNKLNDAKIRTALAQHFRDKTYSWDNITFTDNCDLPELSGAETIVWRYDKPCPRIDDFHQVNMINLARISDSGKDFKIYYGRTCSQYVLPEYIRSVAFSDLNIENLPLKRYCLTFFEQGR